MSMASPTLRSSSSTEPWLSLSSCATDRCARPSTAEILTGTSKTVCRSWATFSSASTGISDAREVVGNSSSENGSSAMVGLVRMIQGFGVEALGGQGFFKRLGHTGRRPLGIEGGRSVAPVQDEGGHGQGRIGAHHDLAGIAGIGGGFVEGGAHAVRLVGGAAGH